MAGWQAGEPAAHRPVHRSGQWRSSSLKPQARQLAHGATLMFEALRQRLDDVQSFDGRLHDASIAVATELRSNVRKRKRAGAQRRREQRQDLRISGFTAREARVRVRGPRQTSGISITADATGDGVTVTASDQVQHLRRELGETSDMMDVFAKHMSVAEEWRARRGL